MNENNMNSKAPNNVDRLYLGRCHAIPSVHILCQLYHTAYRLELSLGQQLNVQQFVTLILTLTLPTKSGSRKRCLNESLASIKLYLKRQM